MIKKKEKFVGINTERLLKRSRKGDNKAMLALSKRFDAPIANMWLVRAVLYGNEKARVILRNNPDRASSLLFPIENFIPGDRKLWFTGRYHAASLKEAGFDELPDMNGSYIVAGLSQERVLVIGMETGEEPPDEDGFGMEIYYDYYVYDEFFHRISKTRFVNDPHAAYGLGNAYIKAHNKLPELRFDWLMEEGILKPNHLIALRTLSNGGGNIYSNLTDSFVNILKDSFLKELSERVIDHDYQKLYNFVEDLTEKLSALLGQPIINKDYLESAGYALLKQNDFEKAYVVFRACAENCNSRVAQFNLGNMFANGHGVVSNYASAYYWFFKASENNVENGKIACDTILCQVAENGNPVSDLLHGGKNTVLPGYRRAMNIQMFISALVELCKSGCDMFPCDPDMAAYLKEQCGNLMEHYK